jgi:signal transduction histidine kinase
MLVVVFSGVACCFIGATMAAEYTVYETRDAAREIVRNSSPSLDQVSRLRTTLRELEVELDDYADALAEHRDLVRSLEHTLWGEVQALHQQVRSEWTAYCELPVFPGETDLWPRVEAQLASLDATLLLVGSLEGTKRERSARELVNEHGKPVIDRLDDALVGIVALNTHEQEALGFRVEQLSRRSMITAAVLDASCVVLTALLALLLFVTLRRHQNIDRARADELEAFAGRVAHDIRGPLTSVSLSIASIQRRATPAITEMAQRAARGLSRVEHIISDLLDFARAGAAPMRGCTTEATEAVSDLLEEMQPLAAAAHIELVVTCETRGRISCTRGVLLSLIGNLVRNAIKYMGQRPVRRIFVRLHDVSHSVRVEVEDTGPGMSREFAAKAFAPFVRGVSEEEQPGIGLGLATVKRLAEAHGGAAGVNSELGVGSVFWFELPQANARPVELVRRTSVRA